MVRKRGQNNTGQSFSSADEPTESLAATPQTQPLTSGQQAFYLATSNKKEIDKIREDINNPQWAKDLIKSQISFNRIIKIGLWLFLLIFLILILAFVLLSIFQVNNLFNILEDIRGSKKMEVDVGLLYQFNQLFFYCRYIATFLGSVIGAIGTISLITFIVIKVSEKFTNSIKTKE